MSEKKFDKRAAILCSHVANLSRSILKAVRDEPLESEDSGWQFTCGEAHDESDNAKVWLVNEVLDLDSSVKAVLMKEGNVRSFVRESVSSKWKEE